MKGLDSSVLLALLEGDASARELLKGLRGVELATTEANLLELSYVAAHGPTRARARRREVLERLRRKITVLPIDDRAVDQASRRIGKGVETLPPLVLAMLGALEAGGCDELFTRDLGLKAGIWRFKIGRIASSHAK